MKVPQNVANPARTGLQLSGAAILVEFAAAYFVTLDERQYAAAVAFLTLAISFLQNSYEAYKGRYLLKPDTVTLKQR